jgi:hypothetical protein
MEENGRTVLRRRLITREAGRDGDIADDEKEYKIKQSL